MATYGVIGKVDYKTREYNYCSLQATTPVAIPNATYTAVNFSAVVGGDPKMADLANHRIIVPHDGLYYVLGYVNWVDPAAAAAGIRGAQFVVNGANSVSNVSAPCPQGSPTTMVPSLLTYLAKGSTVSMNVEQTQGNALLMQSAILSVAKI